MRGIHQTRQTIVWVNIYSSHQIKPKQGQVSEVILRQTLTTKMRMHKTKTAKAIYSYTYAFKIGQLDTPIITHYYILDMSTSIN